MSALGIPYVQGPVTVANEALDSIGCSDKIIGDVSDGTNIAEAVRRNYGQLLRQLLRTAHWNFGRKMARMQLLGDATGQSPNTSRFVERPWRYAYAWPIDCMAARWLPFTWTNGPTEINSAADPNNPIAGFPLNPPGTAFYQPMEPARFLISSSDQYPALVGSPPWSQYPDLQRTEGVGPNSRRVILTDCCEAQLVYTKLVTAIEEWDPLFRQSMVSLMALTLIPVAIEDPKERITQRNNIIPIVRNTIADARVANGNDAGWPQSTDHIPPWLTARGGGGFGRGYGGVSGAGYTGYSWCGWSSLSWGGSVF